MYQDFLDTQNIIETDQLTATCFENEVGVIAPKQFTLQTVKATFACRSQLLVCGAGFTKSK